jgi:hypothetical protein
VFCGPGKATTDKQLSALTHAGATLLRGAGRWPESA